ncbi:hypothetical protein [Microbacterium sp. RG1]|uniref:hypothetical protein n=1 Tax=Microbacterium sp. RG1 TaxID=2489212 RepID=UPI0010CA592C|nr:hypothetical protein [Microbacterium sp. RG1]QCQ15904.1 hypothetical protein EHF32_03700 [Microbacterium sp. RG1]
MAPLDGPPEFDADTAGLPGQVETFFGYLAGGQAAAALRMTDVAIDESAPGAPFIGDEAYESLMDRPSLKNVGEPKVSDDGTLADIDVTYAIGADERSETLQLAYVDKQGDIPAHWVFVVDPASAGFDAAGAADLPSGTRYSVNGVDVTSAFENLSGSSSRVMAFAGTYPLEIAVPGATPTTETIAIDVDTLFGTMSADGKLSGFADSLGG